MTIQEQLEVLLYDILGARSDIQGTDHEYLDITQLESLEDECRRLGAICKDKIKTINENE